MTTRVAGVKDAKAIAAIHMATLPAGVSDFTPLGRRIVERLYTNAIARGAATVLVAEEEGVIAGFVMITENVGAMFPRALLRGAGDILRFLLTANPVGLVRATVTKLASGTARAPEEPELVYLGVDGRFRGKGCGAALMDAAEGAFRKAAVDHYQLDVHAANHTAVGLYRAKGLEVTRRYMKGGKEMLTMVRRFEPRGSAPAPDHGGAPR